MHNILLPWLVLGMGLLELIFGVIVFIILLYKSHYYKRSEKKYDSLDNVSILLCISKHFISSQEWFIFVQAIPSLGRESLVNVEIQKILKEQFCATKVKKKKTVHYRNGKKHSIHDEPAVIYKRGEKKWYKDGHIHRDHDRPAVVINNKWEAWYQYGKLHRANDPAIIFKNGDRIWYQHGLKHRDHDLPAVIYSNGTRLWYHHGKQHRDRDLPAVIMAIGNKQWFQNDQLHRDGDSPAEITSGGDSFWYKHGVLHRDYDMPAAITRFARFYFQHGELIDRQECLHFNIIDCGNK